MPKKYEYKWEDLPYEGPEDRIKTLNLYGQEGWLCLEVGHVGMRSYYLFAREIAGD